MGLLSGAANLGAAVLDLGADDAKLHTDMSKSEGFVKKSLGSMASVAGGIISAQLIGKGISAVMNFGKEAITSAGDAMENMSKFEVSFGDAAGGAEKSLDTFAKAVGRNRYELIKMAADQGAVYKSLGLGEKSAANYSTELSKLAVDVGSFNNARASDVSNAFTKAMTGEFESLKTYGVVLNQTILAEKLRSMGVTENINSVDQATKAEAIYQLLLEKTADAQGDAERTSGSFANQMVAMKAKIEQAKTTIGTKLLPIITPMIGKFNELAEQVLPIVTDGFQKVVDVLQTLFGFETDPEKFFNLFPPFLRDNIAQFILKIWELKDTFEASLPMIEEKVNLFLTWFRENMGPTIESVMENVTNVLNELAIFWQQHGETVMNVLTVAFQVISTVVGFAMDLITGIISAALSIINGDWSGAWETIKGVFTNFLESVLSIAGTDLESFKETWRTNFENVKTIVTTVFEDIKTKIRSFITNFTQTGKDLIQGLIDGVLSKINTLKEAVTSAVDQAVTAAKKLLGIASPSKMFTWIGEMIMKGWTKGILINRMEPVDAINHVAQSLTVSAAPAAVGNGPVTNVFKFEKVTFEDFFKILTRLEEQYA
jgi:hypothetical protein